MLGPPQVISIVGTAEWPLRPFCEANVQSRRAPSLGDIYTLAIHPATSSHRELSPSRRERLGVKENLIRVSLGIEHPDDIIEDIEQALDKL